jgi:dihydropteroate synthase
VPSASSRPRRPAIWGILNVTPDSFSDGGRHASLDAAVAHGLALARDGADVLDVGGESTRPGAAPVPEAEERRRVVPVVRALREAGFAGPLSVDTRSAAVASDALDEGAGIVNDVSAGGHDPGMLGLVAASRCGLVLMHMRGTPETMQSDVRYGDVCAEVRAFLLERVRAAEAAGVEPGRLWIDPGIGFGKTREHNEALLADLESLVGTGIPVLVGASRKAFLGAITGRAVGERLAASLACAARAAQAGAAAVRVHDVAETRDLLDVLARITPRTGA